MTLNSTLGFLEQLFNSSGCLTQLCDTLADDLPKDGQGIDQDIITTLSTLTEIG